MVRCLLAVIVLVTILAPRAEAGPVLDRIFVNRAAKVIGRTGVPADANGMAFTRELRLNWIPFLPPFGANVVAGKGVAFRVGEGGELTEPRFVKIRGGGVVVGIGVGLPFSGGLTREVRSFRGAEYESFTERRHVVASVKLQAAAGAPPFLVAKGIGPQVGSIPGKVERRRTVFVGLFAQVGVAADVKIVRPRFRR